MRSSSDPRGEVAVAEPAAAVSPFEVLTFFTGWIAIGLAIAGLLVRRGHAAAPTLAVGAGLGPLAVLVAVERLRYRDPPADASVLAAGVHRGGVVDVLVLVQGDHEDVDGLLPTIDAIRSDLGKLTVARAVPYEWLAGDETLASAVGAVGAVHRAARRIPIGGAELALLPGTSVDAASRFRRAHRRGVVLFAVPPAGADGVATA